MLKDSQLDLCGRVDFARTTPLLARDEAFSFACAGCGGCCRGREDIVLSGFDLWRIAGRLRLPPQTVARAFCRASIGQVSHLPVLRLAPVKEERNNCPFLTENHCAIHDAEPLVCALYPLAQEISREGEVSYFLQPTGCGGRVIEAKVEDYLARYDVPARERPTSAGRRPAWTWKTWWSRWTPPSSRPCAAGCRRSSGRHSILSLTMRKSTSRSWKKTSSGWAQSCKN